MVYISLCFLASFFNFFFLCLFVSSLDVFVYFSVSLNASSVGVFFWRFVFFCVFCCLVFLSYFDVMPFSVFVFLRRKKSFHARPLCVCLSSAHSNLVDLCFFLALSSVFASLSFLCSCSSFSFFGI